MGLKGVIVLKPKYPANLGLIARSMVSFGFKNLYILGEMDEKFIKRAKKISKQGKEVLDNIKIISSLSEINGLLIGTISEYDAKRMGINKLIPVWKLKNFEGDFYLVFGNENGLRKEDVSKCGLFSTIPTNWKKGILNLAMAVTIYLYELSKGRIKE